jgi:predicted nucleic acid-binding protein
VQEELRRPTAPEPVRKWIADPPKWLLARSPAKADSSLASLDPGERDAIALALELRAERLIIDERRGRLAAQKRGIRVIGTLGVLKIASGLGLPDLRAVLDRLRSTDFYMTDKILLELF